MGSGRGVGDEGLWAGFHTIQVSALHVSVMERKLMMMMMVEGLGAGFPAGTRGTLGTPRPPLPRLRETEPLYKRERGRESFYKERYRESLYRLVNFG